MPNYSINRISECRRNQKFKQELNHSLNSSANESHSMLSFTISSNMILLMPWVQQCTYVSEQFSGPQGYCQLWPAMSSPWASPPCPQPRTSCQSPGASSPCPSDPTAAGPVSSSPQPCLPGLDQSPVSACPGTAPIPPAALLLAGAAGQSLDATPCLDMLKGAPVVPAPSLRLLSTPEVPCSILHGLVAILQHSTAKSPGMSPVKFKRGPRCSNVT